MTGYRHKCEHSGCMANFRGECYASCAILKSFTAYIEKQKQAVIMNNGKGAVGALWGISEYLKERVTHQEAQR